MGPSFRWDDDSGAGGRNTAIVAQGKCC